MSRTGKTLFVLKELKYTLKSLQSEGNQNGDVAVIAMRGKCSPKVLSATELTGQFIVPAVLSMCIRV